MKYPDIGYTTSDMQEDPKICVIGLGFVGLPVAATFADCGLHVTGVDTAPHVMESLKSGRAHFKEAGIQGLLDRVLGKNLTIAESVESSAHDVYIIAVGTPVDEKTKVPDNSYVEQASTAIGKVLKKGDLVVMRSTVPVGTTRDIVLKICEQKSGLTGGEDFDLVFAPERLVSGRALEELKELPQLIGGLTGERDVLRASNLFRKLTPKIVVTENIEATEMGKLIDNSYRDFNFAYANQMALLCEQVGIDAAKLIRDVNRDYKRNRIPVPSPGVGGICLMKDPYLLLSVGEKYGFGMPLTKEARKLNEKMPQHVALRALKMLSEAGKGTNPTVFVLGFAFKGKPETSDTRISPTTDVVSVLQKAGCKILGYDPAVSDEEIEKLGVHTTTIEEGFQDADAVIIMTNHSEFESLDISALVSKMRKPAVLYDGWSLCDPKVIASITDLHYACTGGGAQKTESTVELAR